MARGDQSRARCIIQGQITSEIGSNTDLDEAVSVSLVLVRARASSSGFLSKGNVRGCHATRGGNYTGQATHRREAGVLVAAASLCALGRGLRVKWVLYFTCKATGIDPPGSP